MRLQDPMAHDEDEARDRAFEQLREDREGEMVTLLRRVGRTGWADVLQVIAQIMETEESSAMRAFELEVRQFVADAGWPTLMACVARAMRDEETFQRELVDRR